MNAFVWPDVAADNLPYTRAPSAVTSSALSRSRGSRSILKLSPRISPSACLTLHQMTLKPSSHNASSAAHHNSTARSSQDNSRNRVTFVNANETLESHFANRYRVRFRFPDGVTCLPIHSQIPRRSGLDVSSECIYIAFQRCSSSTGQGREEPGEPRPDQPRRVIGDGLSRGDCVRQSP